MQLMKNYPNNERINLVNCIYAYLAILLLLDPTFLDLPPNIESKNPDYITYYLMFKLFFVSN